MMKAGARSQKPGARSQEPGARRREFEYFSVECYFVERHSFWLLAPGSWLLSFIIHLEALMCQAGV
jgi:hypothetical protein